MIKEFLNILFRYSFYLLKLSIEIIFIILTVQTFGQTTNNLVFSTNPDSFIASEIQSKRIVMLGDYSHHHSTPYDNVIHVLYNWLQLEEKNQSDTAYLVLILEIDNEYSEIIKKYIKSRDFNTLLDYLAPVGYLQDFEFFDKLITFSDKIDSLNQTGKRKIFFDIAGFEPVSGYKIDGNFLAKSQKEVDLWFINTRDSLTANGIIAYLNSAPASHALIFYGDGHLMNGLVDKSDGGINLSPEESKGYFLAYYLKNYFGSDNVSIIYQDLINNECMNNVPANFQINDEMILNSYNVSCRDLEPQYYDYVAFRKFIFFPARNVNIIFNKYIVNKSIDLLEETEQYLPGYRAQTKLKRTLKYLFILTGKEFENSKEWKQWLTNNNYNGSERLDSDEFRSDIYQILFIKSNSLGRIGYLWDLGIENILDVNTIPDSTTWIREIWPKAITQIKLLNAIGLYWIGNEIEKNQAKDILMNSSGLKFNNAEGYLNWYRIKYYGIIN